MDAIGPGSRHNERVRHWLADFEELLVDEECFGVSEAKKDVLCVSKDSVRRDWTPERLRDRAPAGSEDLATVI